MTTPVRGCGIDAVVIGNSVFVYDEGMISCYIEFRRKTGEETKPLLEISEISHGSEISLFPPLHQSRVLAPGDLSRRQVSVFSLGIFLQYRCKASRPAGVWPWRENNPGRLHIFNLFQRDLVTADDGNFLSKLFKISFQIIYK